MSHEIFKQQLKTTSMNNEQPIIVGLDIGTTKIAVIAGRKNEFGKLEILGFGKSNSNGVKHGQVLNIDETIKAIKTALENCFASNPNLDINEVYVGIAGHPYQKFANPRRYCPSTYGRRDHTERD
jgi:cell division ATPase FtsA